MTFTYRNVGKDNPFWNIDRLFEALESFWCSKSDFAELITAQNVE